MFRRILIANRGEAAARVARTCRRLGVATVAVASEADREHAWLQEADTVVCIGGSHPRESYLDEDVLLETARRERCSALHPGWGFLAENARFAARCESIGLTFVGPSPAALAQFGDKIRARRAARAAGLPTLEGSAGPVASLDEAKAWFERLGGRLLLKAAAGGGGKGMRRVTSADALEEAWNEARAQARASFGDDTMFAERLVLAPRHVEFQILVDRHGHAVVLGDRDCSVQRSWQKVLEESPAPGVDEATGARWREGLLRWFTAGGYTGAGTVETLRDEDGSLHFLECNARLQVEHPVTETLWGLDLVEQQLRVAAGESEPWGTLHPRGGHAVECRVNAEDPANGFQPSPGRVTRLRWPGDDHLRIDTHLRPPANGLGDRVPPHYDNLLAKIVAWGPTRDAAFDRAAQALQRAVVEGVHTNIPFLLHLLESPALRAAQHDTGLCAQRLAEWAPLER